MFRCKVVSHRNHPSLLHFFQIDNQQIGTVFPVALYPSPLPVSVIQRSGMCLFDVIALFQVDQSLFIKVGPGAQPRIHTKMSLICM